MHAGGKVPSVRRVKDSEAYSIGAESCPLRRVSFCAITA
jgi:hypothetical protein